MDRVPDSVSAIPAGLRDSHDTENIPPDHLVGKSKPVVRPHRVALNDVTRQVVNRGHRHPEQAILKNSVRNEVYTISDDDDDKKSEALCGSDLDEDYFTEEDVQGKERDEELSGKEEDDDDESAGQEAMLPVYNGKIQVQLDQAYQQCHRSAPDPNDEDTYDVVMVTELASEIFDYFRDLELKYRPNPYYMDIQNELKWSYRSTLIDWLVQVHSRFQLLPETLYLTVNIIDRFLSKIKITLKTFQLFGASALFIAAKYEEINCPSLKDIVYMLDNAYTGEDVIKAERVMINALGFEIGWPGPMSFLRRISKADDYDYDIRTLAKYLLETSIMDFRLVAAPPSWLAAGAYFLSKNILGSTSWSVKHIYYSGYTEQQVFPLARLLLNNCRSPAINHEAIWNKYSERRYHRSAQAVDKWIALAERKMEESS